MASALLDRVKIQAEALVPVLRAFREEFGEERANRVAWRALACMVAARPCERGDKPLRVAEARRS